MEFFNNIATPILDMLTQEFIQFGMLVVFVLLFFALMSVASRFGGNEKATALKKWWELIDDTIYDAIIHEMFKPGEIDRAENEVDEVEQRLTDALGYKIRLDYRMLLVLKHVEAFVEANVDIDVDLPYLYKRAERIYRESKLGKMDLEPEEL